MASPVDYHNRIVAEKRSKILVENLKKESPYSILRAIDEIETFIEHSRPYWKNRDNEEFVDRTLMTLKKVFKTPSKSSYISSVYDSDISKDV